jgi:hypothetical protein
MNGEREAIQRLIDRIKELKDGDEDVGIGAEEWSNAKIEFLRKYGHIK